MTPREQEMSFLSEAQMLDNQEWRTAINVIVAAMLNSHRTAIHRVNAVQALKKAELMLALDEQQCRKQWIDAQAHTTDISPQ